MMMDFISLMTTFLHEPFGGYSDFTSCRFAEKIDILLVVDATGRNFVVSNSAD